jgi:hypothetical protein
MDLTLHKNMIPFTGTTTATGLLDHRNHSNMPDEPKSDTGLFLGALVILALLEVCFALGINALRPEQDNTSLIVMVGAVLVPMITSIVNLIQGKQQKATAHEVKKDLATTTRQVNGRMEELIAAAAKAAHAEGYPRQY